ncbi:hypothetical protein [Spirosoma luteum]|uniref:hypothetical protein n=1 Tax=Spirosoma luteum TaxID=431553 RepID=UPI0003651618|nr:hypothetical protein [Spirosoma luteum]
MNRFSVIYLLKRQYHPIYCSTHQEAEATLASLLTQADHKPIGIYDAKTELFAWEPARQRQYDKASIEKQGKLGEQINRIVQALHHQELVRHSPTNSLFQLLQAEEA